MKREDEIQLNFLFEKVVDDTASLNEQKELKLLYQLFINEGREGISNIVPFTSEIKAG